MGPTFARGRRDERAGHVRSLTVSGNLVVALVRGPDDPAAFRSRIAVRAFGASEWARVEKALVAEARYVADLLDGRMPPGIEGVFDEAGLSLLPLSLDEVAMDCTCERWPMPCSHLAATCYALARAFESDPFEVFTWRGRPRDELLMRLRRLREASAVDASRGTPSGRPVTPGGTASGPSAGPGGVHGSSAGSHGDSGGSTGFSGGAAGSSAGGPAGSRGRSGDSFRPRDGAGEAGSAGDSGESARFDGMSGAWAESGGPDWADGPLGGGGYGDARESRAGGDRRTAAGGRLPVTDPAAFWAAGVSFVSPESGASVPGDSASARRSGAYVPGSGVSAESGSGGVAAPESGVSAASGSGDVAAPESGVSGASGSGDVAAPESGVSAEPGSGVFAASASGVSGASGSGVSVASGSRASVASGSGVFAASGSADSGASGSGVSTGPGPGASTGPGGGGSAAPGSGASFEGEWVEAGSRGTEGGADGRGRVLRPDALLDQLDAPGLTHAGQPVTEVLRAAYLALADDLGGD
ncbi:hypothetical protein SAMN05421541_10356 [Actinoplanes philippinensis]|uniref:SWIM-type domain-containing protein n=1 Tax=Actinoplanes philippinensis TaxID=35752 RepID=A0A1I2CL77_9ACTN|nr:hypothetical protein SAMN05421541_10356 [Actinoplanes philippinensis]